LSYLRSTPTNKIRIEESLAAKNVFEFDHHAVVPVHGYDDVDHYYRDSSAVHVSHTISTRTLAISAEDDPVCAHEGCPTEEQQLGPGLVVAKTRTGGHVGFIEGLWGYTDSWMDSVAVDWIGACLLLQEPLSYSTRRQE
jgi:predicted alpha/beta-fold hydrolase